MKELNWKYGYGEVDDSIISQVENQLGVVFPKDFKECAKIYNGTIPEPDLFLVNDVERVFGQLLAFKKPDGSSYMLDMYEWVKDRLPNGVFPFAIGPGGDLLCFDYKEHEENPIVVYWEHEGAWPIEELMEEEGLTEEEAEKVVREENIRYVASSFTELLEMLYSSDNQ